LLELCLPLFAIANALFFEVIVNHRDVVARRGLHEVDLIDAWHLIWQSDFGKSIGSVKVGLGMANE
jgi:hypothetical protein